MKYLSFITIYALLVILQPVEIMANDIKDSELYESTLSLDFLYGIDSQNTIKNYPKPLQQSSTTKQYSKDIRDLVVATFDEEEGLFAGYEASNGIRILFKSQYYTEQLLYSRILYRDKESGDLLPALTVRFVLDEEGNSNLEVLIGGVNIINLLKMKDRNNGLNLPEERRLKRFLNSDIGQAVLEFVPVMFVKLDDFDAGNRKLANLKMPFGMIRMASELVTNQHAGFPNADKSLGKQKTDRLREACNITDCQFKTEEFVIHNNGLFDIMGGFNPPNGYKKNSYNCEDKYLNQSLKVIGEVCFGECGWGCLAPFHITTNECIQHDTCVGDYDHASCLFSTPSPTGNQVYSTLFDAIGSFILAVFTGYGAVTSGGGNYVWFGDNSPYYTPDFGYCMFDIYCIDNLPLPNNIY